MSLPVKVATACFLRRNGKTLFIDYTNYPHPVHAGKFAPPGGRLDEGETLDNCAIREVAEEQGIVLNNVIYRGKVYFVNGRRTINGKPMNYDFEVHAYDCFDFDDTNARAKEGIPVWVEDNKVLDLPLHEGDRTIWSWLGRYKIFEGEIVHEGERLTGIILKSGTLKS